MKARTKDVILKTLLVIGIILMIMIFPGAILIAYIFEEKVADKIFWSVFVIYIIDAITFIILCPIFGGLKQKPVKAEKVLLPYDDFKVFESFIEHSLKRRYYIKQKNSLFCETGNVTVYTKSSKFWTLDCFAIIRISELSDEILEIVNDKITEILTEYYNGKTITDTVNMISIFCVDRITPTFQKLVNSNIQQGLKNGRLPVGISFGGKKVYIAKQKDGFAIAHYKKLRREFLDVMGFTEEQIEKTSNPKRNAK